MCMVYSKYFFLCESFFNYGRGNFFLMTEGSFPMGSQFLRGIYLFRVGKHNIMTGESLVME